MTRTVHGHGKQRRFHDACWDGNRGALEELLADAGVCLWSHHSCGLLHAAHRGRRWLVERLLPHCDPLAHRSEALLRAAKSRHGTCIRLFAPVSNPHLWDAHDGMNSGTPNVASLNAFVARAGSSRPKNAYSREAGARPNSVDVGAWLRWDR